MSATDRIILGIDPGLANTGWGVVRQRGSRLECVAYGCVSTPSGHPLAQRLLKIHDQIGAVVRKFTPTCVGIETVWFGQNITAAFATGQARGAALVACAEGGLEVGEFTPRQIKLAVVGTGSAEKEQVQYMVRKLLALSAPPEPDHAADALAAAICYTTHEGYARAEACLDAVASGGAQRGAKTRAGASSAVCGNRPKGGLAQDYAARGALDAHACAENRADASSSGTVGAARLASGGATGGISADVYRAWSARARG